MKKLTLTLLVTLSTVAYANNSSENLQQATKLLNNGNFDKAYQLLIKDFDKAKATNQELFLLGVSAKKAKQYQQSQAFFQQLLDKDPNASRVKLELAEAVLNTGNKEYAKKLLLEVKATQPPQAVIDNIDNFLAQIDNPQNHGKSQWRFWAETGVTYDNNANSASDIDTIIMYGLPFTLSEDAKPMSDVVGKVKLGVNNNRVINDTMSWYTSGSLELQKYRDLEDFDNLSLNLYTGSDIRLSPNTNVTLPLTASLVKTGHEKSYSYYDVGFSPRFDYQISPDVRLNTNFNFTNRNYQDKDKPSLNMFSFSPTVQYNLSPNSLFSLGGTIGGDKSKNKANNNSSFGVSADYQYMFSRNLSAGLSLGYNGKSYKAKDTMFDKKREDDLLTGSLNINKRLHKLNSNLIFSVKHSINDSNIPLYDYEQTKVYLGLNKQF